MTETKDIYPLSKRVPEIIVFLLSVFFFFLTPMELGDVWWHLSNGKWIASHMKLPETDPFSLAPSGGEDFPLRAFWLSQLLMHYIWTVTGPYGLIAIKSLVFTMIFSLIRSLMKPGAYSGAITYALLCPSVLVLSFYDESRPQTISALMFIAVIFLLERLRLSGYSLGRQYALPLLFIMPIWANMHAGYVLGTGLIGLYMVDFLLHKPSLSKVKFLLPVLVFSILLSFANPNGPEAFRFTLGMVGSSASHSATIHEHLSTADFSVFTAKPLLLRLQIGIFVLGTISFIYSLLKDRRPSFIMTTLFFGLAGFAWITFRAGEFFAIYAPYFIVSNLSAKNDNQRTGLLWPTYTGLVIFIVILGGYSTNRTLLTRQAINSSITPVKAANAFEAISPPGNIFHPYEWGGYLMWRLYPKYRVFIDGRALGLMDEYDKVVSAGMGHMALLDEMDIQSVIFHPVFPYTHRVPPIVFSMLKSRQWRPVHWDLTAIIFIRKEQALNPIGKYAIWELLQSLARSRISRLPDDPSGYLALGEIYYNQGLRYEAREALQAALMLKPDSADALRMLSALR